jgi:hypothetical protein
MYACLFCPMRPACLTYLILLDLIILITFGEECKLSKKEVFQKILWAQVSHIW